jgi:hypothetical protein
MEIIMENKNIKRIIVAIAVRKPLYIRIQEALENKLYTFCEPKRQWLVNQYWAALRVLPEVTCLVIIAGVIRHWND